MKKAILFSSIIWLGFSCHYKPYELGYCKIFYDNISGLPGQYIIVSVTNQNSHTDQYTLTPVENSISLALDNGDSYYLRINGQRVDSIYNVVVQRSGRDDEQVDSYSFMFNTFSHDQLTSTIRINL